MSASDELAEIMRELTCLASPRCKMMRADVEVELRSIVRRMIDVTAWVETLEEAKRPRTIRECQHVVAGWFW